MAPNTVQSLTKHELEDLKQKKPVTMQKNSKKQKKENWSKLVDSEWNILKYKVVR